MEEMSLDDMVNFFADSGVKVVAMGFSKRKPVIGWQACAERFLLNGQPIEEHEALRHWREGTATFQQFAEKRLAEMARKKRRKAS
jgi:hypothetical protein